LVRLANQEAVSVDLLVKLVSLPTASVERLFQLLR
jgi:hypothetical protein